MKSAFKTLGKQFSNAFIARYLPFLRLPLISQVVDFYLNKYWGEAADASEFFAFIQFIDTRVDHQGNEFVKAAYANHAAQASGTSEEKARAEAELKKAHAAFIHLKS